MSGAAAVMVMSVIWPRAKIGCAASDTALVTPSNTTSMSLATSSCARLAATAAVPSSSALTTSSGRPRTPPAALSSSTAICTPASSRSPVGPSAPVVENRVPTMMGSPEGVEGESPPAWHPARTMCVGVGQGTALIVERV
jgi:hypothetical protein